MHVHPTVNLTFAGVDAFVPRVLKLWVFPIATIVEPVAADGTTAALTRFLDGATFGANSTDGRGLTIWWDVAMLV